MVYANSQVLRWSALAGGVVYGFVHNRTLASAAQEKKAATEWERKLKLIDEAKAKWAAQNKKPEAAAGAEQDINDPNFDVEKFINQALAKAE